MIRLRSLALILLLATPAAFSQSGGGTIRGTVRDVSGAAVAGASVEAKNALTRMVYSAVSSGTGGYSIAPLPPGKYEVSVTKSGMRPYSHAFLSVDASKTITEDVDMEKDPNPAAVSQPTRAAVPRPSRPQLRDVYAEDAEMTLASPMLSMNDRGIELPDKSSMVKGKIVWIYVPSHGRFLLSLAPHPDLGFGAEGEVGGSALKFDAGKDEIQVQSTDRIVMGSASYNLYVLAQPQWLPPNQNDLSTAMIGSGTAVEPLLK